MSMESYEALWIHTSIGQIVLPMQSIMWKIYSDDFLQLAPKQFEQGQNYRECIGSSFIQAVVSEEAQRPLCFRKTPGLWMKHRWGTTLQILHRGPEAFSYITMSPSWDPSMSQNRAVLAGSACLCWNEWLPCYTTFPLQWLPKGKCMARDSFPVDRELIAEGFWSWSWGDTGFSWEGGCQDVVTHSCKFSISSYTPIWAYEHVFSNNYYYFFCKYWKFLHSYQIK